MGVMQLPQWLAGVIRYFTNPVGADVGGLGAFARLPFEEAVLLKRA
ncbi:MAG: hypothetical protein NVS4B6_08600 [Mycobacterium sp.]